MKRAVENLFVTALLDLYTWHSLTHESALLSVADAAFRSSTGPQTTLPSIEKTGAQTLGESNQRILQIALYVPTRHKSPAAVSPRCVQAQR